MAQKHFLDNRQASIVYRAFEAIGLSEWDHVAAVFGDGLTVNDMRGLLAPYSNVDAIAKLKMNEGSGQAMLLPFDEGLLGTTSRLPGGGEANLALLGVRLDASIAARLFELLAPRGILVICGGTAASHESEQENILGAAGFDNICILSSRESVRLRKGGETHQESQTFSCILAEKPADDAQLRAYVGIAGCDPNEVRDYPAVGKSCSSDIRIAPLRESDLGAVMQIEVQSFSNPWTPVAYAMELRHNPLASYCAAWNAEDELVGYVGWWTVGEQATIVHIAVSPLARRGGIGRRLLQYACDAAKKGGSSTMTLQVRSMNGTARKFYTNFGFAETGKAAAYYTAPDDDAILMQRTLGGVKG